MKKEFILALDQGTTSSRAILFDREGTPLAVAQKEFPQIYPQPGRVEHDPTAIWSTQLGVAVEALAKAGRNLSEVAAVGIANQRETTVIWEKKSGDPVCNAVVWQDRRTAAMCDALVKDGHAPLIQAKTGLVVDAYFSGAKAAWILDRVPGARARAEAGELLFGTVDSWLLWKLTGGAVHATDPSNASRTMLYNIRTGDWDEELLALLRVPRAMLPRIMPSSGIFGETSPAVFGAAVPVAGIAGDQQAATFGQACLRPGMVKNTYGTGCFMLLNTGGEAIFSSSRLLTTVAWQQGADALTYALEGAVFAAGAAVQWLRDGLGIIDSAPEVEKLAASVPDSGGVVLVPAFTGLGAPHWDPYARGCVFGLTRGATRAHLARATLESIAFQVVGVLSAMQQDAKTPPAELRVDGGASTNNLLMQFQADILNIPVVRPTITETTALGAAYLAGLGVGFWDSPAAIAGQWKKERVFEPAMEPARREEMLAVWRKAVARALHWEERE